MQTVRIHCRVIEVSATSEKSSPKTQRGNHPRDLLPWADPYIARLMHILEERYDTSRRNPAWDDDFLSSHTFTAGLSEDAWQHDAFIPRPLEGRHASSDRAVFGGFPLLDDSDSSDDTLAL
jgi:hypothetical protein